MWKHCQMHVFTNKHLSPTSHFRSILSDGFTYFKLISGTLCVFVMGFDNPVRLSHIQLVLPALHARNLPTDVASSKHMT